MDHTHYTKWLSVFIEKLHTENKGLFDDIGKHLSVRSTDAEFSKVAYDQNNKIVKARNGCINLVNKEDKTFLRKLEFCSSEVHQFFDQVEQTSEKVHHKEEREKFDNTYVKHCNKVFSMMTVHPFGTEQFQMLSTSMIYSEVIVKDCQRLFEIGKLEYKNFVSSRFILRSEDIISSPIKKNCFKLRRDWKSTANSSPQIKLTPKVMATLHAACESRPEASRKIFQQEFTRVPECLVDKDGKSFHGTKTDLLSIIAPKPIGDDELNPPKKKSIGLSSMFLL